MTAPTTDRANTRGKVVAAAQALFAQRGFHGVSIADVATKAGVSKGSVTHHFKNKEKLWKAIKQQLMLEHANDVMSHMKFTHNKHGESAVDSLVSMVKQYFMVLSRHEDLGRIILWSLAEGVDTLEEYPEAASVDAMVLELLASRMEILQAEGALSEDIDPYFLTTMLTVSTNAWVFMRHRQAQIAGYDETPDDWDEMFTNHIDVILRSLATTAVKSSDIAPTSENGSS